MFMGQEDNRELISKDKLLKIANDLIKGDFEYLDGMEATDVVQNGEVLVFKGEYFFDDQGLPTPKTNAVFNMFKKVTTELSKKYKVA